MLRLVVWASVTALVTGCALAPSREQMYYPSSWAPLRNSKALGCAHIAGNFEAVGENAQPSPNGVNSPNLLAALSIVPRPHNYSCAQLHLNEEQSFLSIVAAGGLENGTASIAVSCVNGNLTQQSKPVSGYSDGSDKTWSGSATMSLANDGSLVVRAIGDATTNDLIFRSSRSYDNYYRFKPCTSN